MKNHASRLKKMEEFLKPEQEDTVVIVIDLFDRDLVAAGYFKDKREQDAFIDWRLECAREEAKLTGRPLPIFFILQEEEIKKHLGAFRNDLNLQK